MKKQELIVTVGLPASGKSTWARECVAASQGLFKRVNKDDIRAMLGGKHSKQREKVVLDIRDTAVESALRQGFSVIVDDTNLASDHIERLRAIAHRCDAAFEVQDWFLNVPLEDLFKRDAAREKPVGKDVIYQMYLQHVAKTPVREYDEELEECILVDLDGTLALFGGKNPYKREWETDIVNDAVASVMVGMHRNTAVFIMSGRDGTYKSETIQWLLANDIPYDGLYMREPNDNRKDTIVKRELFDKHIEGQYNVLFVMDDRPSVVRMWRHELGLTVFQVAPDIEF